MKEGIELGNLPKFMLPDRVFLGEDTGSSGVPRQFCPEISHDNLCRSCCDPAAFRQSRSYDSLGRLIADIDALNQTTRTHYTDEYNDLPCAIEDPTGGRRQIAWDPYGQLTGYTGCSGSTTRYHYDHVGQLVRSEDDEGLLSLHRYDSLGRLTGSEDAVGKASPIGIMRPETAQYNDV